MKKENCLDIYFDENYEKIEIDYKSRKILEDLSIDEIIKKRRDNAKVIYEKLENKEINFLFENLLETDTPLFIPIILKNEEIRNKLRNYLISQNIYCPIHWPIPQILKNKESNIYTREISLICDHRYSKEEVESYIKIVNQFVK